MREKDLQNERLDRIERKLLKAVRMRDEEIEKIVTSPRLFDSVKVHIEAEQSRRQAKAFFGNGWSLSFWNSKKIVAAFAILIVCTAIAAVIVFKSQNSTQQAKHTIQPETKLQIAQVVNILPPVEEKKETITSPAINRARTESKTIKGETRKITNRVNRANTLKSAKNSAKESPEIFYSLAIGGNWEANGEDLQVVRTELSSAELFALGFNLPVENETAKIKTDLLVSADGVARAIRFVE